MISAVLLSWKRPYHIPEIISHLRQFEQVKEVIVWCNEFKPTDEIVRAADRVMFCPKNRYTLGRFLAATRATHDDIFVQDDDLLVNNLPALYDAFREERIITANLADDRSSKHWTWWQVHHPEWVEIGFGAMLPKEQVYRLSEWPYSQDLLARKADKIFTVVHPWRSLRAGSEDITRLSYNGKESGCDANSLSHRQDHKGLTEEAVKLALEWKSKIWETAAP